MCGIAGIIGRLDETNRAALRRMNDAMVHRGPDAAGVWASTPDDRGWGALLGDESALANARLQPSFTRVGAPTGGRPHEARADPAERHALAVTGG